MHTVGKQSREPENENYRSQPSFRGQVEVFDHIHVPLVISQTYKVR